MRKSRLIRGLAYLGYYFGAKHLPVTNYPLGRVAQRLRRLMCSQLFAEAGKLINIERGADFGTGSVISIGDHSGIGVDAWIRGPVRIGRNVMMGPFAILYGWDHEMTRTDIPMQQQGLTRPREITIEDDVWIGARVTILKGVRVGRGAVIAAGAVVTRDVPPFAVVGGNPARVIRMRAAAEPISD